MKRIIIIFTLFVAVIYCLFAWAVLSVAQATTPVVSMDDVASYVSGHPVRVYCDADKNPGADPPLPGFVKQAWTVIGGEEIHLHPNYCYYLKQPIKGNLFPLTLRILIHEAAHARGVSVESCAELYAVLRSYEVLQLFWHVTPGTTLSNHVGAVVLQASRARPPSYQPTPTSCQEQP